MEMLINATPEEVKELLKRDCSPSLQNFIKRYESNDYRPKVMPTSKPTTDELTAKKQEVHDVVNGMLVTRVLVDFIVNNRKKILDSSSVDEYLNVAREIMRLVKAYCKAVEQDTEEGDLSDKRAKGT